MELLKHNQEAYEKVVEMFEVENKVAVVQPTGTGKMYIAIKWLLDNKDKKLLFLAPNSTIMYQFKKTLESNGHKLSEFSNMNFALYYQMLNWEEEDFEQYDCIVLDELHRAGALKWGEKINQLLEVNQDSKVLGLTATPTRYMDKRNMVDEMFEGNVASEITLAEAIARGILPFPTYVSSLYSLENEIDKYQKRINDTQDQNKKEQAQKILDKVRSNVAKAPNIADVLQKHITKKDGHYIVFCKDIEHLEEIKGKLNDWFEKINPNISTYEVHYKKMGEENEQALVDFEINNDKSIKILLSIDKLNEGLHVDNIDGIIMLRPTSSHIIYLQQLGRSLSCNSKNKPLIIDFVNGLEAYQNFYDIRDEIINYYIENGNIYNEQEFNKMFKVFDYISNIMELLSSIDNLYRLSDIQKLEIIKEYISLGNKYSEIKTFSKYNNYPIGIWISKWRSSYNQGKLSYETETELRNLGETFERKKGEYISNDKKLAIIKEYVMLGNKYSKIVQFSKYKDYPIGIWISTWRHYYNKGELNFEIETELRNLGETFECKMGESIFFDEKLEILKEYIRLGNSYNEITQSSKYQEYPIGKWISTWRHYYNKGELNFEIETELRNLGETFERKMSEYISNDKKMEIIKEYIGLENSYSEVNCTTKYQEYPIGSWINSWRMAYKKGKLDLLTTIFLKELGETFESKQVECIPNDKKIEIIKEYISLGNIYSKIRQSSKYKDYPIGMWLNRWRTSYNKGKLNFEIETELRSLGETFEPKIEHISNDKKIEIIKEYISLGNIYSKIRQSTKYKNYPIGRWINEWRCSYKKGKLDSQTEQELKNIGETFEAKRSEKIASSEKITIIKEYISLGHKYSAIDTPVTYKEYPIGSWIIEWRSKYNNGTLNKQTEQSLRDLGETFEYKYKRVRNLTVNPTVLEKDGLKLTDNVITDSKDKTKRL